MHLKLKNLVRSYMDYLSKKAEVHNGAFCMLARAARFLSALLCEPFSPHTRISEGIPYALQVVTRWQQGSFMQGKVKAQLVILQIFNLYVVMQSLVE